MVRRRAQHNPRPQAMPGLFLFKRKNSDSHVILIYVHSQWSPMAKTTAIILALLILLAGVYAVSRERRVVAEMFDFSVELALAGVEEAFQNEPEKPPTAGSIKVPIFIYHSVRPHMSGESKRQDAYDITPELLEEQLAYLHDHGYTALTLNELVRDLALGTTAPVTKPVILTFDDGWKNQYRYAFPLLKKYHLTATFYIYTKPIGTKKHFLTWDQVGEMDAAGMTIGSHTLTHPYLKGLSETELKKEIGESKKIIETQLKKPVLHFASPFGYSSPEIVRLLQEAGYKTARTTYRGIFHDTDDALTLRGILVTDNFSDFVAVLNR